MLSKIRKNLKKIIIKIIILFIILVFALWGFGKKKSDDYDKLVLINDKPIFKDEYTKSINSLFEQYEMFFNKDLFSYDIRYVLENFALKRLIDQNLFLEKTNKLKLYVTDEELIKVIKSSPLFFHNGVFNTSCYKNILSNLGYTPIQFEKITKNSILIEKFFSLILSDVDFSDLKIFNYYNYYNTKIASSYIVFSPKKIENLIFTDKEIYDYFKNNLYKYQSGNLNKLIYISFDPKDYLKHKNIDDSDVLEYYNSNLDLYKIEKSISISHILINKKDNRNDLNKMDVKKNFATKIAKIAKNGNDFGELARLYSDCPSKIKGGKLGAIKINEINNKFFEKISSMIEGEISDPIKTSFGWHIIKVDEIYKDSEISYDIVKNDIFKLLKKINADELAYNEALKFSEKCFVGNDVLNKAKINDVIIHKTKWFDINKGPSEFGKYDKRISSVIASMEIGQISDVHEFNGIYYIFQVFARNNPESFVFDDIKDVVLSDYKLTKQVESVINRADFFIKSITAGVSYVDLLKKQIFEKEYTYSLTKFQLYSNLKYKFFDKRMIKLAYELPNDRDIIGSFFEQQNEFCIYYSKSKEKIKTIKDVESFLNKKQLILNILIGRKKSDIILDNLQLLRKNNKIVFINNFR